MTQLEWITPPTFATGDVMSASTMNIIAHDIELLKGLGDGHQSLFVGYAFDESDAYRMVFYKHANLDYLYHWFYYSTGTSADVKLYISAAQDTDWGSDYFSYTGITPSSTQRTGHTDISSLTDNTWYMLSFDVAFTGSGELRLYRLELKSTNT